jgi:hypothetical protein
MLTWLTTVALPKRFTMFSILSRLESVIAVISIMVTKAG